MKAGGASTKNKGPKSKTKPRNTASLEGAASGEGLPAPVDAFGVPVEPKVTAPSSPSDPDGSPAVAGEALRSAPTSVVGVAATPRDPGLEERRVGQVAWAAAVVVLVVAVGAGLTFGPATAVLVLAAGAFVAVISLFWSSLRTLLGETPLSGADAYAIGAARAEEEQKRAVLRALKDLEFERSVGKISEDDYRRLVAHYRGEAKRLLRILDDESQPMRERAEALIVTRLKSAGLVQTSGAAFRQPAKNPGDRAREAAEAEASEELRQAAHPDEETTEASSPTHESDAKTVDAETSAPKAIDATSGDAEPSTLESIDDREPETEESADLRKEVNRE